MIRRGESGEGQLKNTAIRPTNSNSWAGLFYKLGFDGAALDIGPSAGKSRVAHEQCR